MAQLKFLIDNDLLRKFKQIVLAKHGKIELTPEGEEAVRMYVNKYEHLLARSMHEVDPLARVIGAVRSGKLHNVLKDLKKLEAEEP